MNRIIHKVIHKVNHRVIHRVIMSALACLLAVAPLTGAGPQPDAPFVIGADGGVRVDGLTFESLSHYVESDYFRLGGKRCKTRTPKGAHILGGTSDCTLSKTVIKSEYHPAGTYTLQVVFHIIQKSDGTGKMSDQRIYDQVEALNEDYRALAGTMGQKGHDTRIRFQLAGITRTANDQWFNDNSGFMAALGWDQTRYINVYTNSAGGYLGYATLPQESAGIKEDGIVILYEAVGGRNNGYSAYDQGRTLVHEMGHYLGLLHTFEEEGCYTGYQAGDLIDDTNSENQPHYGCSQTSTCGTADPIHNYMNYTNDSCMHEFTPEQANRMVCGLVNYRKQLITDGSGGGDGDGGGNGGGGDTSTIALSRGSLYFAAVPGGTQTTAQTILVDNGGSGTLKWSASDNRSWLSGAPASGTGSGVLSVSVNPSGLAAGNYSGTITISDPGASNSPRTVTVKLAVIPAHLEQPPFGEFATPVTGSTARGSVPVTGWVLDDVGIESVKIYNGYNYVGNAVMVEGARPDVEQSYPNYPQGNLAGWGYMMLTYFLPGGGNGTYTLYAVAVDGSGNEVVLGSKTITCDNKNAVKPFGAVDTPSQGGTASGKSFVNWGWALTPRPNSIPTNGSTINVYVDGVKLGNPTYNVYRADIASMFPGYANSDGAVGYFHLDTTAYANGVHTIQWTVRDSAGNNAGIGSRYFTVQNTGGRSAGRALAAWPVRPDLPGGFDLSPDPVTVRRGLPGDEPPQRVSPGEGNIITVELRPMERLELMLGGTGWRGRQVVGNEFRPLPAGSSLDRDRGVFYWWPGPGFAGVHELLFIPTGPGSVRKININISNTPDQED